MEFLHAFPRRDDPNLPTSVCLRSSDRPKRRSREFRPKPFRSKTGSSVAVLRLHEFVDGISLLCDQVQDRWEGQRPCSSVSLGRWGAVVFGPVFAKVKQK